MVKSTKQIRVASFLSCSSSLGFWSSLKLEVPSSTALDKPLLDREHHLQIGRIKVLPSIQMGFRDHRRRDTLRKLQRTWGKKRKISFVIGMNRLEDIQIYSSLRLK